jgi:hypothetical protein
MYYCADRQVRLLSLLLSFRGVSRSPLRQLPGLLLESVHFFSPIRVS